MVCLTKPAGSCARWVLLAAGSMCLEIDDSALDVRLKSSEHVHAPNMCISGIKERKRLIKLPYFVMNTIAGAVLLSS